MLTEKVALVTGGSRGIGKAIALRMAQEGADVGIIYAGNEQAAAETLEEIRALGRKGAMAKADVGDYAQAQDAVKAIKEELGPIDILVNNAGITRDKLILRMSPEEFEQVVRVNCRARFT